MGETPGGAERTRSVVSTAARPSANPCGRPLSWQPSRGRGRAGARSLRHLQPFFAALASRRSAAFRAFMGLLRFIRCPWARGRHGELTGAASGGQAYQQSVSNRFSRQGRTMTLARAVLIQQAPRGSAASTDQPRSAGRAALHVQADCASVHAIYAHRTFEGQVVVRLVAGQVRGHVRGVGVEHAGLGGMRLPGSEESEE